MGIMGLIAMGLDLNIGPRGGPNVDPSPLRVAVFLVIGAVLGSISILGLRKRSPKTWNENLDKYIS